LETVGLRNAEVDVKLQAGPPFSLMLIRDPSPTIGGLNWADQKSPTIAVGPVVAVLDSIGNLNEYSSIDITISVDNILGPCSVIYTGSGACKTRLK
jgi:hypothetical protein